MELDVASITGLGPQSTGKLEFSMRNSNPQCSGSPALHSTLWGSRSYQNAWFFWSLKTHTNAVLCAGDNDDFRFVLQNLSPFSS